MPTCHSVLCTVFEGFLPEKRPISPLIILSIFRVTNLVCFHCSFCRTSACCSQTYSHSTSYFMATKIGQPDARHLFSVTDMESNQPREVQCLSCNFHRFCIHNEGGCLRLFVTVCDGLEIVRNFQKVSKLSRFSSCRTVCRLLLK